MDSEKNMSKSIAYWFYRKKIKFNDKPLPFFASTKLFVISILSPIDLLVAR